MVDVWIEAARPRTLPAAIAPVLVGSGLAIGDGAFRWDSFVAALVGALAIQIAANFANDASDAKRGADTPERVGPQRMVATGVISPARMWTAVAMAVAVATAMGVWLITIAGWWIAVIGAVSILAMLTYVGGPIPYGYRGLGEVMVFLFFGLVATLGTRFVHSPELGPDVWAAGVMMGALAAAILVANNLRDLETDRTVGKRTLAVTLGRDRTRFLFVVLIALPFVLLVVSVVMRTLPPWAAVSLVSGPLAVSLVRKVRSAATPRELIPLLGGSARLQLLFGLLLAGGLAV